MTTRMETRTATGYSINYATSWDHGIDEAVVPANCVAGLIPTLEEAIVLAQAYAGVAPHAFGYAGQVYVTNPHHQLVAMVDPLFPEDVTRYLRAEPKACEELCKSEAWECVKQAARKLEREVAW